MSAITWITNMIAGVQTEVVVFAIAVAVHTMLFGGLGGGRKRQAPPKLPEEGLSIAPVGKDPGKTSKKDSPSSPTASPAGRAHLQELKIALAASDLTTALQSLVLAAPQFHAATSSARGTLPDALLQRLVRLAVDQSQVQRLAEELSRCDLLSARAVEALMAEQRASSSVAQRLLDLAQRHGVESTCPMQCAVLKALGGERRLKEAWEVYNGCSDKPACLRNTMMDVCVGSGDMRTAERIFAEAQADKVADVVTFNTIIKAYLKSGDTKRARSAKDAMQAFGLQPNVVTFNELIDATLRSSRREDLWVLIDEMHACGLQPNQVTCSILLKSIQPSSRHADVERTLAILDRMSDRMDEVLLSSACEACIRANRCDLVQRLLWRQRCDGVKVNGAHTFGSIIRSHGYVGDLAGVWTTWREMRARGIRPTSITTGCMVEALVTNDGPEAGYELIRDMLQEKELRPLINSVIYNSVLKGFAHHKRFFRVWEVYQEMLKEKLQLSIVTYNTLVDACAKSCEMSRVQGLMQEMVRFNIEPNIVTYSTILKGYVQENNLQKAFQLLQEMKQTKEFQPDEIAYNTLLDGCARQGHMEKGLGLLADMQAVGVPPSNFTLSVLVKLANRSHQVDKAFALCEELSQKYSLRLNIHVYNNLMQACTARQDMPRALSVLEKLVNERVKPDARTYSILLRGCINSGDPQGAAGLMAAAFGLRKPLPPVADASSLQVRGGLPNELVLETLLSIAKQCKADQIAAGLMKDLRTIPGLKLDSKALLRVASPSTSS